MPHILSSTVLPLLIPVPILAAAAAIDLRTQRIPNYLTFPSILIALIFHALVGGADGFIFSILGAIAGIALLLLPYAMGGMGAGDAKLLGAVGAFAGAKGVFLAFLFTALAGGIYALGVLIIRRIRAVKQMLSGRAEAEKLSYVHALGMPCATEKSRLCYGLAIALGSLTYLALAISGYPFPI